MWATVNIEILIGEWYVAAISQDMGHVKDSKVLVKQISLQDGREPVAMAPLSEHYCAKPGTKWHHQHEMAAIVSLIVWLHFYTLGESQDSFSISSHIQSSHDWKPGTATFSQGWN